MSLSRVTRAWAWGADSTGRLSPDQVPESGLYAMGPLGHGFGILGWMQAGGDCHFLRIRGFAAGTTGTATLGPSPPVRRCPRRVLAVGVARPAVVHQPALHEADHVPRAVRVLLRAVLRLTRPRSTRMACTTATRPHGAPRLEAGAARSAVQR